MKKSLLFSVMVLSLSACNDISGTFNVTAPSLQLVNKSGNAITVAAGSQSAELNVSSGKLQLKIVDEAGKKQTVQVKIPNGAEQLPTSQGQFSLPASESKQPVDMQGSMTTENATGREETRIEGCTIYTEATSCQDVVIHPPHQPITHERRCTTVRVGHPGRHVVRYHSESSSLTATLQLKDTASGAVVGQFEGTQYSGNTVVDSSEICHF